MWEPVCRLTQCGHRQRAWYRSWGNRFRSLSNLWRWHSSGPGGQLAGQTRTRSREGTGWKCQRKEMEGGPMLCSDPGSGPYLLCHFE